MIGGPGKLRVARVPHPQIEHALHTEQTASFPAFAPLTARFERWRANVLTANGFDRRPTDFLDDRSCRWERRHPCRRVAAGSGPDSLRAERRAGDDDRGKSNWKASAENCLHANSLPPQNSTAESSLPGTSANSIASASRRTGTAR